MVGSHTKERSGRATAVFDIDSASVGVGIFIRGTGTDELVWSHRVTYSVQQELDYTRFVRTMLSALLEAGMKLSTEGLPHMHTSTNAHVRNLDCLCVLSGPWFMGKVASDCARNETTVAVSQAFLKERTEALHQSLLSSPAGEHFKNAMRGAKLMETSVLRVLLNGYPVEDWSGRLCSEVSVAAWFALASPDVLTQIQGVVEKVLPNATVMYRSSTLALYMVVRTRLPQVHRLSVVEVGGELTTVTNIEDGIMQNTVTFPIGEHSILRLFMGTKETENHARGKLSILRKKLPTDEDIPGNVRDMLTTWSASVTDALQTVCDGITPPRNIALVAGRDVRIWFTKLLEQPVHQQGIREPLGFRTVPLVPTPESDAPTLKDDARLTVLGFGLSTELGVGS